MNTKSLRTIESSPAPFLKFASVTLGVIIATGLFLTAPRACADDMTASPSAVATADKDFMLAAAQGGMTEVKLGGLAVQDGLRQEVKDFGGMMVKDHTTINDDLKALATQKNVSPPAMLDEKHQAMVDKMGALSGAEFDKAYVSAMIKAHKKDLKAFQAEAAATQDTDIKSFVEKAIPTISAHLQHIQDLKSMMP